MVTTTTLPHAPATGHAGTQPASRHTTRQTPKERYRWGKQLRERAPLASQADVVITTERDSLLLLEEQSITRVPELVPIRYGRMAVSPWTFYRGAAYVMATDLAATPNAGIKTQVCGDAHIGNFGLFGTAERRLVFDINDFDETSSGPFEWDVKRMTGSLTIAARQLEVGRKIRRAMAMAAVRRYRESMANFATMTELDVWYASADADAVRKRLKPEIRDSRGRRALAQSLAKAHTRDSIQALDRMTYRDNGDLRITADPPLIVPLRDLISLDDEDDLEERFRKLISQYRRSLRADLRLLLERYRFRDMARKVVGVGSVGTRCWVVLLTGRDDNDPLFLQVKEANQSVISTALGAAPRGHEGQRVVDGQRLMQAAGDIFLGWQTTAGIDGVSRDFYVRQLRDWKFSVPIEQLRPDGLRLYAELCGWTLARAHARAGDAAAIAGYLGSRDTFDTAIAEFAETYADLTEQDFARLTTAIAAKELVAQTGL